jgi:hypothetical protein
MKKKPNTAPCRPLRDLTRSVAVPRKKPPIVAWTYDEIIAARDQQMAGRFDRAVRLAESLRTDDAFFNARRNRLAPQSELEIKVTPYDSIRGRLVATRSAISVRISNAAKADLNGYLADHGVAVGYNVWRPRQDGSMIDVSHHAYPLEFINWNPIERQLVAWTDDGPEVVRHGDGRWTVYANHSITPWRQDAAVLPGALVWALLAFAKRDWGQASGVHGNAKVVGKLPEGVPMRVSDEQGNDIPSPEVINLMHALEDIASQETTAAILPFGTEAEILAHPGRAWEVFAQLVQDRTKSAYQIYLGTDALLGATGGAPGVDISQLLGVARVIISKDLHALENGFREGIFEPWTEVNFGDRYLAPRYEYIIPQPDEQQAAMNFAERQKAFFDAVRGYQELGFEITDEVLAALREQYSIPIIANRMPTFDLSPVDKARAITVDEVRESEGLEPLGGEKGAQSVGDTGAEPTG